MGRQYRYDVTVSACHDARHESGPARGDGYAAGCRLVTTEPHLATANALKNMLIGAASLISAVAT